ncbi:MAG: hypothetical protein WCH74_10485 [Chloroflexota bacterium]
MKQDAMPALSRALLGAFLAAASSLPSAALAQVPDPHAGHNH